MIYALGVLETVEPIFDIEIVQLTIHQPRLQNVSTWEISVDDLKTWGNDVLNFLTNKTAYLAKYKAI